MMCPHCNKNITEQDMRQQAQYYAIFFLMTGMSAREVSRAVKSSGYQMSPTTVLRIKKRMTRK